MSKEVKGETSSLFFVLVVNESKMIDEFLGAD